MRTIRRLIYVEVLAGGLRRRSASWPVLLLRLRRRTAQRRQGRQPGLPPDAGAALRHAAVPSHLYELLPIAVLIGTIFVMARFAQSSEYTILRTSGLGPWRALRTLLAAGRGLHRLTFAAATTWRRRPTAPASCSRRYQGMRRRGRQTGAWLKERQRYLSYNVNVWRAHADGRCRACASSRPTNAGFLVSPCAGAHGALRATALGAGGTWSARVRHRRQARRASTARCCPACAGRPRSRPRWCRWRCSSPTA
jgi:lipopolysaccharide export system permease protein